MSRKAGKRGRRRLLLLIVPILLIGGWWSLEAVTGQETEWFEVSRDDLVLGVEVNGDLNAVETTLLGPPQIRDTWQFKIARLAPEGEQVEEGTPVVVFDASQLQQQLMREMAERDEAAKKVEKRQKELEVSVKQDVLRLAEARAKLRKAELKAESPEELQKATELAEARLDLELSRTEVAYLEQRLGSLERSAEATLAALRAQFEQAEQQVVDTQSSIDQMSRTAPRDGTVVYVTNWRDEKKKVGDSCWRGEKVIELPDLTMMKAMGKVHESDAGALEEGQRVTFRLDAHPDVEFTGRVASIWRTVQRESWRSKLKVVRLEIELDETDTRRMRPGMRFRGEVETDRVEAALLVDSESIFLKPEGPTVYRKTWMGHEAVRVKLGRRSESRVEVLEGLGEGDLISGVDLDVRRQGA